MQDPVTERLSRRVVLGLLLGGLLLFSYAVLQPFLVPVAWAVILVYATWPLYERLLRLMRRRATLAALAMTMLLAAAFIAPAVWLGAMLRTELASAYADLAATLGGGRIELPGFLADIPLLGNWLQELLDELTRDPATLRARIPHWVEQRTTDLLEVLGGVGRNAAKFTFAIVTAFFLYRSGREVLAQARFVLHRFLGARIDRYLEAVGSMTMAVVWGLVATAIAQGIVAAIGYWWFGLEAPIFLGAVTAAIALIPFGTPFAWGSIGAWLLVKGEIFDGIGLLLWGTLVVSWVDNLVRPLVISSATRISFLLVMFGVLGGLAAFGLIGLFLGPVVLAVLMAVWREWLEESAHATPPAASPAKPPDP
ncbi:MAG: AI-2E family transporter [Burkholderiales bacterium 70-64]|nr:MAG: AI-2E family transporter [Burkholderiales bacterium 70-64]